MRKRCIEGYAAAAFLVVARATTTTMVDDGDPGIQYHGTWVHNLIKDPTDLNYGGSVTFTNVSGSTATSTDAAVPPPPATSSTSQSGTSTPASGIASPTSTPALVHSSKLAAGAIAGLAVAALVLILIVLVGLVGWRSRRRKQAHRRDDLTPYDPGLTALASEPSEKQDLAHDSDVGSRGSTATSLLLLFQPTPAYTQAPAETRVSGSSGPGERSVPHEIRTTDLDGMRMGRDRRTGFEPLGSSSSASPLLARHPHGGRQQQKDSPITSSAGLSRYTIPLDERRRSVDGGVRIAGGPPGNLGQEDDPLGDGDDDVRSGLSTLPPSYQLYTVV